MPRKYKVTNSETRKFGELKVVAEFSDLPTGFHFRLRCGETEGAWCGHYESFAQLRVGERMFGLGTAYWGDFPPCEEPFEIVKGALK